MFTGPVLIRDKKKYMLLYKRCMYTRKAISKRGIVWKCSASKTDGCSVLITTDENLNVVLQKGAHTHKKRSLEKTPKHVYFTCDSESKTKKSVTPKTEKSKDDEYKTPKKVKKGKSGKTESTTPKTKNIDEF